MVDDRPRSHPDILHVSCFRLVLASNSPYCTVACNVNGRVSGMGEATQASARLPCTGAAGTMTGGDDGSR